ncbi:MAG: VTT domain-containing protein [Microvirga sp.]|nr:VTT domain-containing protein [Microvirga sp.]
MQDFLIEHAGNPAIQLAALFVGPFILEEAALLGGATLAAAGELSPAAALLALYLGMVVSDWLVYALGALAGRSARVRSFVGEDKIAYGRRMLQRGALVAYLTARLVPWLLFPIFAGCGFVGAGFLKFAALNAVIAAIYTNALFWSLYGLDLFLFAWLDAWAWPVIVLAVAALVVFGRMAAKRYAAREKL